MNMWTLLLNVLGLKPAFFLMSSRGSTAVVATSLCKTLL